MKTQNRFKSRHAVALIALALSPVATSQILNTFTWVAGDGNWHTVPADPIDGNWFYTADTTLPYPTIPGDAAVVTGEVAVTLSNADIAIEAISVELGANLIVDGPHTFTSREITVGRGSAATLTLNQGTLALSSQPSSGVGATPRLVVGWDGGGAGVLTQTGGSLSTSATKADGGREDFWIAAFGASGVYNLQGGTADIYNLRCGFANDNSVGTINHSGGTLTHHGEMALGWAGAKGIYNLSGTGNLVQVDNRIRVGATGNVGTEGTFNQSGGTASITNGRLELGTESGGKGTYNMSGGTMTLNDSIFVGAFDENPPKGTSGVYNQTGGDVTTGSVLVAFETGTTGSVFLGGGTLRTGSIFVRSGLDGNPAILHGGTGTLTFDGGTAVDTNINGGDFIYNFPNVTVNAGGATIDTNGITNNVNVLPPVVGVGGFTKKGDGLLDLVGANSYTGNTAVQQGTLKHNFANSLATASTVTMPSTGATLQLNYTGSNTVSQLIVDGTPVVAGTYGTNNPTAAGTIGVPYITGTGTLIVTNGSAPVAGYSTWASDPANGLAAGQRAQTFDADNDGFSNLLEYFLGGNPSQSSTAIAPVLTRVGNDIQISFNRASISAADTTAVVQWSTDLTTWSAGDPVVGSGAINMTILGSHAANGKLFARVKVSQP
jgi:autotransporter-associated beta strand protein